jgi:hypothetical protein
MSKNTKAMMLEGKNIFRNYSPSDMKLCSYAIYQMSFMVMLRSGL